MDGLAKDVMISIFMGLILPGIILNVAVAVIEGTGKSTVAAIELLPPETSVSESAALTAIIRNSNGITEEIDMDTYLVGVVLAEMPAYFEPESLKAQAVVARTYTRKAYLTGGKHGDGSVCCLSNCCQAYISETEYLLSGGTQENVEKVRKCVLETSGMIVTFEGDPIEATYFSCSGGSTEDAVAVWGTDYPYLRAVVSPGEESATYYTDTVNYTKEQLENKLDVSLTGNSGSWFSDISYTSGGGVKSVTIGGKIFTGTKIRSLLALRSTAFTVIPEEASVTIMTRGYGHRVGMSQYGADAMATNGSNFREILAHYYPGTEIERIS